MKTYKIEIERRESQFTEWHHSKTVEIRAKNLENAMRRLRRMYNHGGCKLENPYQKIGRIDWEA
jgi:hypothetical protein